MIAGEDENGIVAVGEFAVRIDTGRQEWGWYFSGDECKVSNEGQTDSCEDMNWLDTIKNIWSKDVLSSSKDTESNGGDTDNLWSSRRADW